MVQLGFAIKELLLEVLDGLLLLGNDGLGIFQFHLKTTNLVFQFSNFLLGLSLFEIGNIPAQVTDVVLNILWEVVPRLGISVGQ